MGGDNHQEGNGRHQDRLAEARFRFPSLLPRAGCIDRHEAVFYDGRRDGPSVRRCRVVCFYSHVKHTYNSAPPQGKAFSFPSTEVQMLWKT